MDERSERIAKRFERPLLTARERVLGPTTPRTRTTRDNLAAAHRAAGGDQDADALSTTQQLPP